MKFYDNSKQKNRLYNYSLLFQAILLILVLLISSVALSIKSCEYEDNDYVPATKANK
mgnify:CR=1 FL=1